MLRIAVVGFGKIARDRHLPAIAATDGVELAAIVDPVAAHPGVPCFPSLAALLEAGPAFDAVALCTPPQVRRAEAARAILAGKHVLLEKPPGATVAEVDGLVAAADAAGVAIFAAWHSRFAPAVEPLRSLLRERRVAAVRIDWREDVRVWHPGQDWIFAAGGLGVFDPGINALSILTRVLPQPLFVTGATLEVPANRAGPVAAALDLADASGTTIRAAFDFLQSGPQTWEIRVETDAGTVVLSAGGAVLRAGGRTLVEAPKAEYPAIYRRFADLAARGAIDVDTAPLRLVADAFLVGRRETVASFDWTPSTSPAA